MEAISWRAALRRASIAFILLLPAACGPSAQNLELAQAEITRLRGELDAAKQRHEEDERNYADTQRQIESLKESLGEGVSRQASAEEDLQERLRACEDRDCPARCTAASTSPATQPDASPATIGVPAKTPTDGRTIPFEGNGGGPTLCADGQVSGSAGRGTCSHHGGIAGGRHRKH